MIVHLSADTPARLDDLDRLDRLHAVCVGEPGAALLAEWCQLDAHGEHLWLDVALCRTMGSEVAGPRWADDFDAMIAFAASRGWTDDEGRRVRAHIERADRRNGA